MISRNEYEYLKDVHELLGLVLQTQAPSDTTVMTVPETQLMVGTAEWVDRLCDLGEGKKWVPARRLVWASEVMGPQMDVNQAARSGYEALVLASATLMRQSFEVVKAEDGIRIWG